MTPGPSPGVIAASNSPELPRFQIVVSPADGLGARLPGHRAARDWARPSDISETGWTAPSFVDRSDVSGGAFLRRLIWPTPPARGENLLLQLVAMNGSVLG